MPPVGVAQTLAPLRRTSAATRGTRRQPDGRRTGRPSGRSSARRDTPPRTPPGWWPATPQGRSARRRCHDRGEAIDCELDLTEVDETARPTGRAGRIGRVAVVNGNRPRTLADLLAPKEEAEFLREVWQTSYAYLEGPEGSTTGLFGWEDLNGPALRPPARLAAGPAAPKRQAAPAGRLHDRAGNCRAAGWPAPRSVPTCWPASCAKARRSSSTTWPRRSRGCAGSPTACRARSTNAVNVNLYASWRRDNGFGLHWDDHDVFILQIAGAKDWQIYPDTAPHPLRGSKVAETPPDEAALERTADRRRHPLHPPAGGGTSPIRATSRRST